MIIGALRIKNEARWIEEVLESISFCDQIMVLDDHSTDDTVSICRRSRVTVYESPFTDFDEARDKEFLLGRVYEQLPEYFRGSPVGMDSPHWCLWIDGDEVLEPGGERLIREAIQTGVSYTLRVVYLWDRRDQMRVDGVYGRFTRPSLFRLNGQRRFMRTGHGNLHCSSVPEYFYGRSRHCPARLFHLGYMDRGDRLRKLDFYRGLDPHNERQDDYRHMVQGDIPEVPAAAKLKHAGPLELAPL